MTIKMIKLRVLYHIWYADSLQILFPKIGRPWHSDGSVKRFDIYSTAMTERGEEDKDIVW